MTQPPRPDRRLAPRPFPAHLASAAGLWLSSRAALTLLKSALPLSSAAGKALHALAAEIDQFGSDGVAGALDAEIALRAEAYILGLEAYRRHSYRRIQPPAPVVWQEGTTRLLDCGTGEAGGAVLVVPSLINRYYILDLLPDRSFVRHLAACGLRPLVVDWDAPGAAEREFDLTGYVERLERAVAAAAEIARKPLAVLGYCMGGLLALAAAARRRDQIACLALLATPWDFHAGRRAATRLLGLGANAPVSGESMTDPLSVDAVQSFFFLLDPFLAQRKFIRFARIDPASAAARDFVALEDWINDGVPLARPVANECMRSWYRDNEPARGTWFVAGDRVQPEDVRCPALVVIPGRDRIVPPLSAEPLAAALGRAEVLQAPLGHVGMMAAARAPGALWAAIARWLTAQLLRKRS